METWGDSFEETGVALSFTREGTGAYQKSRKVSPSPRAMCLSGCVDGVTVITRGAGATSEAIRWEAGLSIAAQLQEHKSAGAQLVLFAEGEGPKRRRRTPCKYSDV